MPHLKQKPMTKPQSLMNNPSIGNSGDDLARSGGRTWKKPLRQTQKERGMFLCSDSSGARDWGWQGGSQENRICS